MRDPTRRQERLGHRKYLGVSEDKTRRSEEALAEQMGDGWMDVLTKLGSTLGRAAGSKVGQEVLGAVLPTLAGSVAGRLGKLINPAQEGEGLMLAGQRGRAMMMNPALAAMDPMAVVQGRKPRIPKQLLDQMGVDVGSGLMLAGKGMKKRGRQSKKKMMMSAV